MKKGLDYYRSLPYRRIVTRFQEEEDGETYFCVSFVEIPEVKGLHQDRLKAIQLANELFDAYVVAQLSWHEDIPEPNEQRYRLGGLFKIQPPPNAQSMSPERAKLTWAPDDLILVN